MHIYTVCITIPDIFQYTGSLACQPLVLMQRLHYLQLY